LKNCGMQLKPWASNNEVITMYCSPFIKRGGLR